MFKGAIFDLDGVIVDTVPMHFKAWKTMFAEYGVDFNFEDYKSKVDGIPRYDGAKAILNQLSDSEINAAGDKKQAYFLRFIEEEDVFVYESTLAFINELKKHDKRIAFASSSRNCKRILERVGIIQLGEAIVDGHDISRGKPDPQIFQLAAERLKLRDYECFVVEDAALGVKAAKNAKMPCIGVDRYNNPERLKQADIVVRDLSEISYQKVESLFKK